MKQQKDKIKTIDKKLRKHIEKKDLIKIYRKVTDGEANISGFILQMSKDFLLIQNEEEFWLNGYSIIRKYGFDSIRLGKTEKYQRKVLDKEGILKLGYGLNTQINLQSWEAIFQDLKQKGYFAIVECEDLKKPTFTIGEILIISRKSVGIRYFTPQGIIDKEPTKIKYNEISLVKFDDIHSFVKLSAL